MSVYVQGLIVSEQIFENGIAIERAKGIRMLTHTIFQVSISHEFGLYLLSVDTMKIYILSEVSSFSHGFIADRQKSNIGTECHD